MIDNEKVIETLATHTSKIESLEKRMNACEETNKAINTLATSVSTMSESLKYTNTTLKDLKTDVSELKNVDSKKWKLVIKTLITVITSGAAGYVLQLLIK